MFCRSLSPFLSCSMQSDNGPIDTPKTVADIRQAPNSLPDKCVEGWTGRVGAAAPTACLQPKPARHAGHIQHQGSLPSTQRLHRSFHWDNCDIDDDKQLTEVYDLLCQHYVEDDENMFRWVLGGVDIVSMHVKHRLRGPKGLVRVCSWVGT